MDSKEEYMPFLEIVDQFEAPRKAPSPRGRIFGKIATILNILLFCASLTIYWSSRNRAQPGPVSTDIRDAWSAVQYEERPFTGALKYDTNSKELYREQDAEREYFGPPSILIEDAWDRLLHDEFVPMTGDEAASFEPELTKLPWEDKVFFEPDVLHSLHCINGIRNELSKYMYNSSAVVVPYSASDLAHLEHCMDRLRQSIMCHGDLTPSPLYSWPGSHLALGRSGVHTCRKWEPIREWLNDRKVRGEQS